MSRHQSLLDELQHYAPADALERDHHAALIDLLTRGDDVFTRDHFDPGHVTASCYVIDAQARLLLHRHRRLGRWLQMGGHLEADELPSRAALREAEEESGLNSLALVVDRIFDIDVHPIPAAKGEPHHRHFDVRYLARTATPERIALDPEESEDLAWTDLARAAELLDEEAGWRVIRKIRSVV